MEENRLADNRLEDYPISGLRFVHVYRQDRPAATVQMMHHSQVKAFLQATINLHNGEGSSEVAVDLKPLQTLWKVEMTRVDLNASKKWWSSPKLAENDPDAAAINHQTQPDRLWTHPDLVKEEKEKGWEPNVLNL